MVAVKTIMQICASVTFLGLSIFPSYAAGQTSTSFRVVADVFCAADAGIAVGGASNQSSLSVAQWSVVGVQTSASFGCEEGFQAATDGLDSDHDGIPDGEDPDSDGDGVPDAADLRIYDTDNDGENNLADNDDDADGLTDMQESQYGTSWVRTDSDDDSQSDYEEAVVLLTDPTDGSDFLRCSSVELQNGQVVVSWASEPGVTNYWVQRTTNIAAAASWTTLAGPISAAVGTNRTSWTDVSPPEGSHYRIRVPY
ncbi:MAG: hypothetical protein DRP22_00360 [Verrucomicrobia bacterium]|nr:MAG: hypothetical protein DRP22_00360 [Verrucomicrobiota bacterium]